MCCQYQMYKCFVCITYLEVPSASLVGPDSDAHSSNKSCLSKIFSPLNLPTPLDVCKPLRRPCTPVLSTGCDTNAPVGGAIPLP